MCTSCVLGDVRRGQLKLRVDRLVHDGGERRPDVVNADDESHDGGLTASLSDLDDEQLGDEVEDATGDLGDERDTEPEPLTPVDVPNGEEGWEAVDEDDEDLANDNHPAPAPVQPPLANSP
jgi:hypothetical protein